MHQSFHSTKNFYSLRKQKLNANFSNDGSASAAASSLR
jgi:hypothetical protein